MPPYRPTTRIAALPTFQNPMAKEAPHSDARFVHNDTRESKPIDTLLAENQLKASPRVSSGGSRDLTELLAYSLRERERITDFVRKTSPSSLLSTPGKRPGFVDLIHRTLGLWAKAKTGEHEGGREESAGRQGRARQGKAGQRDILTGSAQGRPHAPRSPFCIEPFSQQFAHVPLQLGLRAHNVGSAFRSNQIVSLDSMWIAACSHSVAFFPLWDHKLQDEIQYAPTSVGKFKSLSHEPN